MFDCPKVESLSHLASDSTSDNRRERIGLSLGLNYLRVAIHTATAPTAPNGAKVRKILVNPSARIARFSIGFFFGLPKGGDCSPPSAGCLDQSLSIDHQLGDGLVGR